MKMKNQTANRLMTAFFLVFAIFTLQIAAQTSKSVTNNKLNYLCR